MATRKTGKTTKPKSAAKNAYALLDEVKALIRAEPRRYNQTTWIAHQVLNASSARSDVPLGFPNCGTVGCIAGWVATLKHGEPFNYFDTPDIAQNILGLTQPMADSLFAVGSAELRRSLAQTPEHAKAGIQHIARFQKRHAKRLKAKAV